MSKGDNRLKILYILDELKQNSKQNADNEEKFMSATELINALNEKYNMNADRKSVYSYIESLIKFGYDIKKTRRGYYLVEHYDRDEATFEATQKMKAYLYGKGFNPTYHFPR